MSWIGLKHKTFGPMFPSEFNAIVDALDILYGQDIKILGKIESLPKPSEIPSDVNPAVDAIYNLGAEQRRWRSVYAIYGYFDKDLFVQGRRVIKDQDPIYIADFIENARNDIDRIKVDISSINQILSGIDSKTEEIRKISYESKSLLFDFDIAKAAGSVFMSVDWSETIQNIYLKYGLLQVTGDVTDYRIVSVADENIPRPEGSFNDNVLKVIVKAGGTARIMFPIRGRFVSPIVVYSTIYTPSDNILFEPKILPGGSDVLVRRLFTKPLKVYPSVWGRFIFNWFIEFHHGFTAVALEIKNNNSEDKPVYIGPLVASEISPNSRGYGLMFGWEGQFSLELNNETVTFTVPVLIPVSPKRVAGFRIGYGIAGDGTNPLNIKVTVKPGDIEIINDSNSSESPKYSYLDIDITTTRDGSASMDWYKLVVELSTSGRGRLVTFYLVFYGFEDEYVYQKHISLTVSGGDTVVIARSQPPFAHICGGELVIKSPFDGNVDILGKTPEGKTVIYTVPSDTTDKAKINGRYLKLWIRNNGFGDAEVGGYLLFCRSLLLG